MDVRAGGKGSAWKLCIGLAVVCGVLVFAAGFLHRNAVASAIDAQQTKSVSYVHGKLANAVGNDKLTKELGDRAAADLKKEADVPAGTDVRIYALDGTPVFSSGRLGAGDRAAITAAGNGEIRRVVDGSDLGGVRVDREQRWEADRRRRGGERHRRGARRRGGTPRWVPVAAGRAWRGPAGRRSGADGARRRDQGRCGPCEGRRRRDNESTEGSEGSEGTEGGSPCQEPCVGLRPGSRARTDGRRAGGRPGPRGLDV